jgi:hypothetical protein
MFWKDLEIGKIESSSHDLPQLLREPYPIFIIGRKIKAISSVVFPRSSGYHGRVWEMKHFHEGVEKINIVERLI